MVTGKHSNFHAFKSFRCLLLICGIDILQVNILIHSLDNFINLQMMVNNSQTYGFFHQVSMGAPLTT